VERHERSAGEVRVRRGRVEIRVRQSAADRSRLHPQGKLRAAGVPERAQAGNPRAGAEKKSRIFELRTYEAHSRKANKKKVEMFDVGEK
jgi:hypothetical protein